MAAFKETDYLTKQLPDPDRPTYSAKLSSETFLTESIPVQPLRSVQLEQFQPDSLQLGVSNMGGQGAPQFEDMHEQKPIKPINPRQFNNDKGKMGRVSHA